MSTVAELNVIKENGSGPVTIAPDATVLLAARKLRSHHVGCLMVVDSEGRLVGVVSERDIVAKVTAEAADPNLTSVRDVMTANVISCPLSTTIAQAQKIMTDNNIRHLPVVRGTAPVAMISTRDILRHRLDAAERVARQQTALLKGLETQYPGITSIQKDSHGRIVI